MTTTKRIAKFEDWFSRLQPADQLKTLACLMRLKKVRSSGNNYDKEIKKCIFRLEKKRGNSELLKFFAGINISEGEFNSLVFKFFDLGRKIRGHREKQKLVKRAGICGALAGGIGIFMRRTNPLSIRKK